MPSNYRLLTGRVPSGSRTQPWSTQTVPLFVWELRTDGAPGCTSAWSIMEIQQTNPITHMINNYWNSQTGLTRQTSTYGCQTYYRRRLSRYEPMLLCIFETAIIVLCLVLYSRVCSPVGGDGANKMETYVVQFKPKEM